MCLLLPEEVYRIRVFHFVSFKFVETQIKNFLCNRLQQAENIAFIDMYTRCKKHIYSLKVDTDGLIKVNCLILTGERLHRSACIILTSLSQEMTSTLAQGKEKQ